MSRSAWRGENRNTSAPKRERSKRLVAVAMSSMPQHAVAKGIGQTADRRAQLITRWSWVVRMESTGSAASMPMWGWYARFDDLAMELGDGPSAIRRQLLAICCQGLIRSQGPIADSRSLISLPCVLPFRLRLAPLQPRLLPWRALERG